LDTSISRHLEEELRSFAMLQGRQCIESEGERRLENTYKSCMDRIIHISKDQVGYRGLPLTYRRF